jgi:hypothetical protein
VPAGILRDTFRRAFLPLYEKLRSLSYMSPFMFISRVPDSARDCGFT